MLDKLQSLAFRYEELTDNLADPAVIGDPKKLHEVSKEHADLRPLFEAYTTLKKLEGDIEGNMEIIRDGDDAELSALAKEELGDLKAEQSKLQDEVQILLLPSDPNDKKNVILEVRAGTGGDEASLFAGELFRMYLRYAERSGWNVDILSTSEGSSGGFKEAIAMLSGDSVYSSLKFESGVHRVQRVPQTESQGRIHTSAVTVAVLPEADDVEVDIKDKDLRIDVYRSSGAGGQHVNTTDSAVRITHLPTGMVVTCQDEKSQHKNKAKALKVLGSRLLDKMQDEQNAEIASERRSLVKSGDRSDKIRTYNFPQDRVTDHRIGLTVHNIPGIMQGDLEGVLTALRTEHQAELLKNQGDE